jgi:hypothetical protein
MYMSQLSSLVIDFTDDQGRAAIQHVLQVPAPPLADP